MRGITEISTRLNKVWIVLTVCSVLAYTLYWFRGISEIFFRNLNTIFQQQFIPNSFLSYALPLWSGTLLRLIGFFLALFSVIWIWGSKQKWYATAKKLISFTLLFEGIYFLAVLPTNVLRIIRGSTPFSLYFAFILQVLLVFPFLFVLSIKVWFYRESAKSNLIKWSSLAALSYLIGLWINNVFRWISMAETEGIMFILTGTTSLGFLNSVVTLSLSIFFAVAGLYILYRKGDRRLSMRLFALSLIMLGLYYVFFIVYSVIADALMWVLLVEIWPITLLGLGLSMVNRNKLNDLL